MKTLAVLILFAGLCAVSAYDDYEFKEFMAFEDEKVSKQKGVLNGVKRELAYFWTAWENEFRLLGLTDTKVHGNGKIHHYIIQEICI